MPRKDKKKKSKGKKGLSTADILKLLKKLKPQTQQIVRVNVGEQDKKKKKAGEVQSSYNPPFVFPAITSLGQPPYKPPLIEEPRQAATWSSQPVKEQQQLMPPPPPRRQISFEAAPGNPPRIPQITDISESEFSEVEVVSRRKPGKGYSIRAPRTRSEIQTESTLFQAPKTYQPSNLSTSSAQPSHFNLPVENDKFQEDIIHTDPAGDQIGTLADKISSSEWTGTPEGNIILTPEEIQAISEAPPLTSETAFGEELQIEVPIKEKKKQVVVPVQGMPAPQKEVKAETGIKSIAVRAYIDEINKAVRENGFIITNIPSEYIATRGATKGQIKQESKNKIMSNELDPIYQEMLVFTGKKSKKEPFIVKKVGE
jgi:hypothetical protein